MIWQDANMLWVMSGTILLGITAAIIGGLAVLRQRALIGNVIAHATLPGLTMAFVLFESNSPPIIFTGALISALLGYYLMNWITQNSKLKSDAAMAIVLSVSFGIGLLFLAAIQNMEIPGTSGLERLLFGQAATMNQTDLIWLFAIGILVLTIFAIIFHRIRMIIFNQEFAKSLGVNTQAYELVFALLLVMTVVVGLQVVGVVLMAAALLIPVTIARFWTKSLQPMLLIAAFFSALSAFSSSYISFVTPKMPTGSLIIVMLGIFFVISWLIHLAKTNSSKA